MRSEECQRVANAKREFNQRLNGNPPDKTRLTMYDLIYYNPSTNPMKKPAVKTEKRDGDSVSVTSVRTIESRTSSVKTESSVKSESAESESNMPVPQLKLGPNGEIILDEKSLVIETTGDKEARAILANSDVVYDDEFSGSAYSNTSECLSSFLLTIFIPFIRSQWILQASQAYQGLAARGDHQILSCIANHRHRFFRDAGAIPESYEEGPQVEVQERGATEYGIGQQGTVAPEAIQH